MKFLVASLLFCAVHASQNVQTASNRNKETLAAQGPAAIVSGGLAARSPQLMFHVTFDECVSGFSADSISITPSGWATDGECTEESANQMYHCTFTVPSTNAQAYGIHIAAEAVTSASTSLGNLLSNKMTVTYYPEFTSGQLVAVPADMPYKRTTVDLHYEATTHMYLVSATDEGAFDLKTTTGPPPLLKSLSMMGKRMEIRVKVLDTQTLVAKVNRRQISNGWGPQTQDSNTVTVPVSIPSPDCKVTQWSEWTQCSTTCTSYNAAFQANSGSQRRTREISSPQSDGGLPCPPLELTQPCNQQLCQFGSRPFSGEFAGECGVGCAPVTRGRTPTQEASGCFCEAACEARGDCCQGWAINGCGTIQPQHRYTGIFPLDPFQYCAGRCRSNQPAFENAGSSYYCFCDVQCTVDKQCCGGQSAWEAACPGER